MLYRALLSPVFLNKISDQATTISPDYFYGNKGPGHLCKPRVSDPYFTLSETLSFRGCEKLRALETNCPSWLPPNF